MSARTTPRGAIATRQTGSGREPAHEHAPPRLRASDLASVTSPEEPRDPFPHPLTFLAAWAALAALPLGALLIWLL